MPNPPPRTSARRLAAIVLAGLLAAAVAVVGLLKATPAAYRRTAPVGPDPAAVARFNEGVVNKVGNVLLDKSGGTPLDLEITEEMINARMARFLADEAEAGRPVTPVLRDLRVGFEPGTVILATRLGSGATGVVVSQDLLLEPTPEGDLRVRPGATAVGLVPLPGGLMDYARRAVALALARREEADPDDGTLALWRSILDGLDGKPVPLGRGRKAIRLERVEVERGVLRMTGRRAGPAAPPAATPG